MKKSKLFSVALLLMVALSALLMASCGNNDNPQVTPPKDLSYDKTGGTLVQESGIDEGDIVKTYGNLAYKFQSDGLVIYKLTNGEATKKAYYKFPSARNIPLEMHVYNDNAVLLYGNKTNIGDDDYSQNGYTGNDGKYSKTFLEVISIPENTENAETAIDLAKNRRYTFSIPGQFVASRLYTETGLCYFAFSYAGNFNYAENADDVISMGGSSYISYSENGAPKTLEKVSPVPGLLKIAGKYPPTVFLKLDLSSETVSSMMNAVYGAELQDIYMSQTSIIPVFRVLEYRTTRVGGGCYSYSYFKPAYTTYCFLLSPSSLKIIDGVTLLDYTLYDRRAIKDYGDVIYITATKTDDSGTTVIALDATRFSLINRLDKIAPDEDVKSVTFGEEGQNRYCYITTFRQIDPLFKIDVTDPYKMTTLGFMEMPGFSTFMLTVGDKLLTLGYADNGAQGRVSTVKIAIYDAKGDGLTPIDELTISNVYYCEAITDPRVIAVSGNRFAFSASSTSASSPSSYSAVLSQALYVFEIQNDGLEYIGKVSEFYQDETDRFRIKNVEIDGQVFTTTSFGKTALSTRRARFIDEYLYTFSDAAISSYKITDGKVEKSRTSRTFTLFSGEEGLYLAYQ